MPWISRFLRDTLRRLMLRAPVRGSRWLEDLYVARGLRQQPGTLALDLGCGRAPRNPFAAARVQGIDARDQPDVVRCDLALDPIPVPDASVHIVTAFDLLEHIPRVLQTTAAGQPALRYPFVELMQEIDRILVPGGLFFSATPCFPSASAFQDPTHVNLMTEETLGSYFCGPQPWAATYGYHGRFERIEEAWIGSHYHALLRKAAAGSPG